MATLRVYETALSEVIGAKVVEVAGYVSLSFGRDTPVFKITRLLFEDGTAMDVEGEHDMPYLPDEGGIFKKLASKIE